MSASPGEEGRLTLPSCIRFHCHSFQEIFAIKSDQIILREKRTGTLVTAIVHISINLLAQFLQTLAIILASKYCSRKRKRSCRALMRERFFIRMKCSCWWVAEKFKA
ncbi:unnamed protein product [Lactuca virosa]|uniref:Uncharacterized protein n=1 Tax=Lactuca virosa TaxID=75947 RepID=A0AAU9N759_9ASTR|nr:unnamed protein product [Lactuca virosa]